MAAVTIDVQVKSNGEVVLGKLGNALEITGQKAETLNRKVTSGTKTVGEFANAAGRTSAIMARSADAFGLNAGALRSLNDVMDVAELGAQGLTKTFIGTRVAMMAMAGPIMAVIAVGAALGALIGKVLNQFESVRNFADKATAGLYDFLAAFKLYGESTRDQGAGQTSGLKEFSAAMAAKHAEALKKQAEQLRAGGMSDKDIAKFYKGGLTDDLRRSLGITDEQVKAKKALEERLDRERDFLDVAKAVRDAEHEVALEMERQKRIRDEMAGPLSSQIQGMKMLPGARAIDGMVAGAPGADRIDLSFEDRMRTLDATQGQVSEVTAATVEWYDVLTAVAAQFDMLSRIDGPIGSIAGMLGNVVTSVAGIGAGLSTFKNAGSGLSGLLGKISGIGSIVGSAIGIGSAIFGGFKKLFGGKSDAEKQAERDAKKAAEEKARAEAEARRAAGLTSAQGGISSVVDNLTYTNAAGQVVNTFSDPKVAEAAAGLFGATFWETFRKQGVAGIDALRPAWGKLHDQLVKLGMDPVKMGLGRVGQLFDITGDPKTKALLGVASGAGQMLRGAMDAGYVDKGFVADSATLARQTLAELQGQGLDANTAAQSMADQLTALAQAYAATGQEMPEDLRAAMEAAGLEVLPTQLEVLKESRDYLKQMAGAAGYAEGGVVRGPRLVRVGESGPEVIMPLDRPRAAGAAVNVTIQRSLGTTRETEYAFDRRVERTMRRLLRNNAAVRYDTKVAVAGGR